MAPIHQLPEEILIHILLLVIEDVSEPLYSRYRLLHPLREVSTHWNNLILNTSAFWAMVFYIDLPAHTRRVLGRSKEHPLDVVGDRGGLVTVPPDRPHPITRWRHPGEFVREILPHAHRWRSARLSLLSEEIPVLDLGHPAPLLESFDLWCDPVLITEGFLDTPRLRNLDLHGVEVPWSAGVMSNLRWLSLKNPKGVTGGIDQVLQGLSGIPLLETLSLDYGSVHASGTLINAHPRILLPHLHTLRLYFLPYAFMHTLLSHIDAHDCYQLDFEYPIRGQGASWPDFAPLLLPYVTAIERRRSLASHIRIVSTSTNIAYELKDERDRLVADLSIDGFNHFPGEEITTYSTHVEPIKWLLASISLGTQLSTTLVIASGEFDCYHIDDADVRFILEKLPALHRLDIRIVHSLDLKHRVLRALSDPKLCSKLKILEMDQIHVEEVLKMVKPRYGAEVEDRPAPLERLAVYSTREPAYREIASIIGEEHLFDYESNP